MDDNSSALADLALVAKMRAYVLQRLFLGHTQQDIAKDLGVDRAMVSKYKTGAGVGSLKSATTRRLAKLTGLGPELEAVAIREFMDAPVLPTHYEQALWYLKGKHGRDFTDAAVEHFMRTVAHKGNETDPELLASQIYEHAQEAKGKAVGVGDAGDDTETGERLIMAADLSPSTKATYRAKGKIK